MHNKAKIRVGILFGGKSAEHEVSLQSAKNVLHALNRKKYEPVLIGIDKKGKWLLSNASQFLLHSGNPKLVKLNKSGRSIALVPQSEGKISNLNSRGAAPKIDVVFPVLHGPFGEDGTVQGLLKLANIPFVGAGVLGSAVGMDKDVMIRLLRDAKIPIPNFLVYHAHEKPRFREIGKKLGLSDSVVNRPKKAMQYGSGIAKEIERFF